MNSQTIKILPRPLNDITAFKDANKNITIICECRQITEDALLDALASGEILNLEDLCQKTQAGLECGSCRPKLRELMGEDAWCDANLTGAIISPPEGNRPVAEVLLQLKNPEQFEKAKAGQHVSIRAIIDGRSVVRSYTVLPELPGQKDIRLCMRLQPEGGLTPWVFEHLKGHLKVQVSQPFGNAFWVNHANGQPETQYNNTVCFVAGTGVTLALALAGGAPPEQAMQVHYRARNKLDLPYCDELRLHGERLCNFQLVTRDDESNGIITDAEVANLAKPYLDAKFVLCGPPLYMDVVQKSLLAIGVAPGNIHVEKFFLSHRTNAVAAPIPTPIESRPVQRWVEQLQEWLRGFGLRKFAIGGALASLSLLLFLPALSNNLPHHNFTPGHEKLACVDCHLPEKGSMRQQLQTKVSKVLGQRESALDFQHKKIDNKVCNDCHQRTDDKHPSHRFYEPRFATIRADLGPHQCVSCHREHEGTRMSNSNAGFCSHCHQDLKISQDPATPTHAELIKQGNWQSCLQCHDYHDNHVYKTPKLLKMATPVEEIAAYLQAGKSPYGEIKHKASAKPLNKLEK